jgi:hypothetical protein
MEKGQDRRPQHCHRKTLDRSNRSAFSIPKGFFTLFAWVFHFDGVHTMVARFSSRHQNGKNDHKIRQKAT